YSEFAGNIDARLIAERHVAGKQGRVASHQVRPFVAIHSDAVTNAMSEELVIRSIARVDNHLTCGCIDGLALNTRSRRLEGGGLCPVHDIKNSFHLVGRFAEDESAADVGLIPFDWATAIDQHQRTLANDLWNDRPMWK